MQETLVQFLGQEVTPGNRIGYPFQYSLPSLVAQIVKNKKKIHLQCRRPGFDLWVGQIPGRRAWRPTPVFFLEISMDNGAWWLQSMWSQRVGHDWVTKHLKTIYWYLDVAFSPIRNDTAALDCILNSYCNLRVPFFNQALCLKNSFVVVQLLSHVQFCETPWIVAHQAFPSITISQFAQTHVCWVSDAIQPSYPLLPLLLSSIFPSISIFTMNWLFSSSALSNKEISWIFPVFWITPVLQLHLLPLVSLISFPGSPIPSFHLDSLSWLFLFPSLLLGAF